MHTSIHHCAPHHYLQFLGDQWQRSCTSPLHSHTCPYTFDRHRQLMKHCMMITLPCADSILPPWHTLACHCLSSSAIDHDTWGYEMTVHCLFSLPHIWSQSLLASADIMYSCCLPRNAGHCVHQEGISTLWYKNHEWVNELFSSSVLERQWHVLPAESQSWNASSLFCYRTFFCRRTCWLVPSNLLALLFSFCIFCTTWSSSWYFV